MKNTEFLNSKAASEYLGIKPSYLHKLCRQRVLPYTKPNGKMRYFSIADLKAYLNKHPAVEAKPERPESLPADTANTSELDLPKLAEQELCDLWPTGRALPVSDAALVAELRRRGYEVVAQRIDRL